MSSQWQSLGELVVTDEWQEFPGQSFNSDSFRITTTVSAGDWENKVRSGIYLRFRYSLGFTNETTSRRFYISVSPGENSAIYDLPIPKELRQDGILFRGVQCRLSSGYAGKFALSSFAVINLKIEENLNSASITDRQLLEQIAQDITAIKNHLGI